MMNSAVIVAAGQGARMGPNADKLFLTLAGRPVIAHTWKAFNDASCIDEIILVIRAGAEAKFAELAEQFHFSKPFKLIPGGKDRQDSVWNGLQAISRNAQIVAIQDGARPCASEELIQATIDAARASGAAVAAQRVTDTIKLSEDGQSITRHLQRDHLWAVQTPQTFRVEVIVEALRKVRELGLRVTDDTAACELIGQQVALVESVRPNPKLTRPEDLACLENLLSCKSND